MKNNKDSKKKNKPLSVEDYELSYLSFLIGCHIESMERELDDENDAFKAMVIEHRIVESREIKSRIKAYGHPTIKPLDIIKTLIENSSRKGDLVLDPFIGSGTTAVACKSLGRNYIGFEINEKYYRIANERIEGFDQNGRMNLLEL